MDVRLSTAAYPLTGAILSTVAKRWVATTVEKAKDDSSTANGWPRDATFRRHPETFHRHRHRDRRHRRHRGRRGQTIRRTARGTSAPGKIDSG